MTMFKATPTGDVPLSQEEAAEYLARAAAWLAQQSEREAREKTVARAAIDSERDAQLAQGFTFNGSLYHCDNVFQSQVQAYLLAWQTGILPAGATVSVRRKDNVTMQMGQADVAALAAAIMAHVQIIYAASWAAKDAL